MLYGYLGLGGEKKAVESTRNVLMNEKMALRASTADHKAYVVNMQLRISDKVKGIRPKTRSEKVLSICLKETKVMKVIIKNPCQ